MLLFSRFFLFLVSGAFARGISTLQESLLCIGKQLYSFTSVQATKITGHLLMKISDFNDMTE